MTPDRCSGDGQLAGFGGADSLVGGYGPHRIGGSGPMIRFWAAGLMDTLFGGSGDDVLRCGTTTILGQRGAPGNDDRP